MTDHAVSQTFVASSSGTYEVQRPGAARRLRPLAAHAVQLAARVGLDDQPRTDARPRRACSRCVMRSTRARPMGRAGRGGDRTPSAWRRSV